MGTGGETGEPPSAASTWGWGVTGMMKRWDGHQCSDGVAGTVPHGDDHKRQIRVYSRDGDAAGLDLRRLGEGEEAESSVYMPRRHV